jgi:hypothetical protein
MCVRAGGVHGTHSYSGYAESSYAKTVWGNHPHGHGGNTPCTNTVAHGTLQKYDRSCNTGRHMRRSTPYTWPLCQIRPAYTPLPVVHASSTVTSLSVSFAGNNPSWVSLWHVRTFMYNTHSFASQNTIKVREDWCLTFRILNGGRSELGESATRTYVSVRTAV